MEKLAKIIASAGVCSRREAEQLIKSGKVKIDNELMTNVAHRASPSQKIEVNGQVLKPVEKTRLFIFYKPRGCITSTKDPEGRKIIFDYIPKDYPRLIYIGRLDYNSEGLLLLTNSGELARSMELPSSNLERVYRVRAFGKLTQPMIDEINNGITLDGISYKGAKIIPERQDKDNIWFRMILQEGKNREIRKILQHYGLEVSRLIRVSYGKYKLPNNIKPAEIIEVYDKNNFG